MVRALSFRTSDRPDSARVMAMATAILLHVLALLLLLIPMTQYRQDGPVTEPRTVPWVQKVVMLPPPAPPQVVPVVQPMTTPAPQRTLPSKVPQITAPVIDSVPADHALPATDTTATAEDGGDVKPGIGTPLSVSSLAYVRAPAPLYPRDALRTGAQGTVLLKVLVDTDGSPLEVTLEKSSGNRSLDREAIKHVRQHWRFQPAMQDGQRVRAYGLVPIVFSLQ